MFLVKHLNQEKLKYDFEFKIKDLKSFETAFKVKKIDFEKDLFFVILIF
jgi:hypothetical protein